MTNQRRIEANRKNASRSTGPRTEAGKAISSMNAIKHGLTAAAVVLPDEDAAEFDQLSENLMADLAPVGEIERALVDQIVVCIWRRRRLYRVEKEVLYANQLGNRAQRLEMIKSMNKPTMPNNYVGPPNSYERQRENAYIAADNEQRRLRQELAVADVSLGRAFETGTGGKDLMGHTDVLGKLTRYESMLERSMYKALEFLRRLQAERRARTADLGSKVIDVEIEAEGETAPGTLDS